MKKVIILLLFLMISASVSLYAVAGGIFYELHLSQLGYSNSHLNCNTLGVYSYDLAPGGIRLGWILSGMMSSIDPSINVLGSLNLEFAAGLEYRMGIAYAALTGSAGLGISVSDLGTYPVYLMLLGEAQLELGAYLVPWLQLALTGGLEGFANLVPFTPFGVFAYYTPLIGIRLTWHG